MTRAVWRGEMRNSDGAGGGGWGEESRAVLALIFCATIKIRVPYQFLESRILSLSALALLAVLRA